MAGIGIGFGSSFYLISKELEESNLALTKKIEELDSKIKKLETKK